jgi:Tfp pilus assembly protein PilZ
VPRIKLHIVERTDLLKYFDPTANGIGLFVAGAPVVSVGDRVTVEVLFQGGPRVLLAGSIAWRRTIGDARTRPGVGVTIEPREQPKIDYLMGYVRGALLDARQKRRLPVRLRVTYEGNKGRRINFTRDLSQEGAFVRTSEAFDVGARTTLLISPPRPYRIVLVRATVARRQDSGIERGIGVQFDFETSQERQRMLSFVNQLETDYLEGRLPDETLL